MSSNILRNNRNPTMPKGVEVASYGSYEAATRAVEKLGEKDFPLTEVTIVGSDMHTVEKILGRLTPARVAFGGATQGLTWGVLMGLMSFVFIPEGGPYIPLIAMAIGVLAGMVIATATWGLSTKRRSFAAQTHLVASRYAILVTSDQETAYQILKDTEGNKLRKRATPARLPRRDRAAGGPPSEYGSRPDEKPRFGVRLPDGSEPEAEQQERRPPTSPKGDEESSESAG